MHSLARLFLALTGALILSGCTLGTPSLSPAVRQNASEYSNAMSDFSDKALLENVLRARDRAPLNFNDMASITGTIAMQESAGLSIPFGARNGSSLRSTASAGVQTNSTPVLSIGTLNNQGFILSIMQPVPPIYILSKWNNGYPYELLLYLFVKSVSFADDGPVLLNNPDDPAAMAAFNDFVHQLVDDHVALKPIKLLEPIGPSFPVGRRVTEVVPERSGNTRVQRTTVTDTESLSLLNSLKDGALHVGNAACESPTEKGCAQLYKENPAQVAVCVGANYVAERDSFEFNGHAIYAMPRSAAHRDAEQVLRRRSGNDTGLSERAREDNRDALLQKVTAHRAAPALYRAQSATAKSTDEMPGDAVASRGSAGASTARGSMPQVAMALLPGRISAILDRADCRSDEVVLPAETEEAASIASQQFARVEWRSISEIIAYLGAVARHQTDGQGPRWREGDVMQSLLELNHDENGRISAHYRGQVYALPDQGSDGTSNTHGLEAFALVNELLSTAKIAGNLPVTQQLQILP